MYEGNRSLFDKIRDFFNELKQAFDNLTQYRSWEQGASLGADSVAKIAEVFDRVAANQDGGGGARDGLKLSRRDVARDAEYMDAVSRGDMETAQKMVNEAAREALENGAEFKLADDDGVMAYKLHRGKAPRKTLIVYKTFNVDENGLPHATYAGTEDGMPYGVWLDAVAQPYVVGADGNKYIPGTTGTAPKMAGLKSPSAYGFKGYTSWLSYRPAFHASTIPAPLQMRIKNPATGEKTALPHNKLIFRVEVSADVDYQDAARAAGEAETERRKVYWRENAEYRAAKRENDVNEARKAAEKKGKPFDEEAWLKAYDAKGDKVIGAARDQLDSIPEMGVYRYRNQGEDWVLAGSFRVLGAVTEEEVRRVNDAHGYPNSGKSKMEWIGGYNPQEFGLTPLKDGENPPVGDPRYKSVKVADPVTYDDDGNVIPLSKRFNPESTDVRFSAKDTAQRERDARTAERIAEGRKQSAAQHRAEGRYEAANARARERIDALKQRVLDERAAGEINTAIVRKEANQRIAELKQRVLDERAAGEINTAIARKEGRERTAEALAEQKEHYAEQEAKKAQKEIRDKAVKTADELIDWIMSPTRSKRHVPKDTLYDIANTLGAITLGDESRDSTEAKNWRAKVEGMKAAVAMVNEPIYSGPYDQAIEVSENIGDDLAALRKALNPGNPNSEAAVKRRERDAKAKQAGQMVAEFIPDVNGSVNIDQMNIEEIGELERTLGIIKNAVIRTSEKTELANARKYAERITGNAKELTTWLSRPTDKHHVPEYLRNSVANFVETIDLDDASSTTKKATDWRLRLHQLKDAMQRADAASGGALAISNDPALNAFMTDLLEKVPSEVRNIKQMDAQQLEELDRVMTIVKRTVAFANKTFKSAKFEHISAVGDVSIAEMNSAKGKSNFWKTFPGADRFFNSQQLDSFSFFHGLGGAAQSILQEMRDGFDAKVNHIDQAAKFVKPLVKGVNIRKISGDTAKAYDLKLESGAHIRMTTAQMMELYELLKRDQARLHIFGGGIRIADIGRAGLTRDIKQVEPVTITARDAVRIVSNLTDSQKKLADKLAWFMGNECAAWGNDTSMLMYGYRKFTEENYYPIHSDPNSTLTNDKNDKNQNGAFAMLENLGMTKATQDGANNAIVIGDIFDTFVQHVDDMASYNGLTPAISDAMKWYNYQAGDNQSVKRSLERVAGDSAKSYFETFIKQLNGVSGRGERIGWASKLTSNAKSAAIGCNLRVWVQQPGAYFRAGAILKDKYMRAGLAGAPMVREAKKYCPIAKWKSWGFYDVAIGKSMRGLLLNDDGLAENIRSASMAPAGIADSITFGALFRACYAEQRDLHPKWTREQQMAAAGKRLSEVIDRTQVVDTPFHRSALMRSNDGLVKLQTAFMAEPTKNYNLMRTALADMADKSDKEAPKRFVKTALATMTSMVATSALAAIADVGRDDDEDETVKKKYWEALKENLKDNTNPLKQIPFVKDVMSIMEGYNASRLDMQGVEKLLDAFDMWKRHLEKGTDSRYTHWDLAYKTAQALSTVSGIPVGNLMREVKAIENMVGISLRTKTDLKAAAERYEELFGSIIDAAGDHAQLLADALDKVER
jgi:hypothetical protein